MPSGLEVDALKALVTHSQLWSDWSTLVVVIGLVGEVVITFAYTKDKPLLEIVLGVLCGVVIALGVFGEYRYGSRSAEANRQLRAISEREIAELNNETQKSKERTAALELQLADRHITLDQRKRMLDILHRRTGRIAVTYVTSAASDAQEYSIEIGGVFHAAKWTVVPHPWLTSMDTPVHGFAVEIRDKGSSSKRESLERTTRDALSVLDQRVLLTHGGHDPGPGMDLDLIVFVGSK